MPLQLFGRVVNPISISSYLLSSLLPPSELLKDVSYTHFISSCPSTCSVGADVKAVRETLEEQGFVVETLMNPTKNRLLNGITDFIDTHGYEQGKSTAVLLCWSWTYAGTQW